MKELPMKTEVYCSDGIAGLSIYVIGNPINQQITHLVVKSLRPPFPEYLVPVDAVEETAPHQIKLKCTRNELEKMEPFTYEEYVCDEIPTNLAWPYVVPDVSGNSSIEGEAPVYVPVKNQNVPQGEIAVWRGAKVEATDGYVGQVDELLVNAANMQVTHLVLLERHIFEQKDITIPVSQIERVDEDTIYLKLDRKSIEALPTTPFQRWPLK